MKKFVLFILCCFIMGCSSGLNDVMKITKITPTSDPTYCLYEAQSITFTPAKTHSLFYGSCSEYNMNDSVVMMSDGTQAKNTFLLLWILILSILLIFTSAIKN